MIFIDSRRKKDADRRSNYNNKRDIRFKRTLRDTLNRGELVYALAVRLRKKDTPGKLYKSSKKGNLVLIKIKFLLCKKE